MFAKEMHNVHQTCVHHKLPISWNFNKIYVKIIKNMFMQNPCDSNVKMAQFLFKKVNDVPFYLWCYDVCMYDLHFN